MNVTIDGVSETQLISEVPFEILDYLNKNQACTQQYVHGTTRLNLVDVGESSQIRTRVENHDRKECWKQHYLGVLKYTVSYFEYGK